jgi:periplasmic divalent cation tolerance protein
VYMWKGKMEKSKEVLLLAKTKTSLFSKIKKEIKNNHPYELPEIISIGLQNGLTAYFSWIDKSVLKG